MFRIVHSRLGVALRKAAHLLLAQEIDLFQRSLRVAYSRYLTQEQPVHLLISGLIAAEDHRFALHRGLDLVALARALARRVLRGTVEGASTIEQQLVRTITSRRDRTISRKLQEILIAAVVTEVVPKQDIPGLYLSLAYFGWATGGFREALAELHFSQTHPTPRETAEVIARLKYPAPASPSAPRLAQINARAAHILWKLQCAQPLARTSNEEVLDAGISGIG